MFSENVKTKLNPMLFKKEMFVHRRELLKSIQSVSVWDEDEIVDDDDEIESALPKIVAHN